MVRLSDPGRRGHPQVVRDRFIELVAAGWTATAAAGEVGVSRRSGAAWWLQATDMVLPGGRPGSGVTRRAAPAPVPPGPPAPRSRLTQHDRDRIMTGLRQGWSHARIGALIGRDRTVVWREVRRHAAADGLYYAGLAQAASTASARRPKPFRLAQAPQLVPLIQDWMDQGWSPQLIASVLRRDFPQDRSMHISHETIYQCLYVQTRGELRKDLAQQLSLGRVQRRPRTATRAAERRGRFNDVFTIADRPAEAADRAVPGHWEGDLIIGGGGRSAIGTLVERSTRFTILLHLPADRSADTVATAMIQAMKTLPEHLRRSITWDRGKEMGQHARINLHLGTPVYFCDPHAPWQRGTNENTNRLLRHWFTKGSDLAVHTAADLKRVQDSLNQRPRPTLDLATPAQKLNELLAQTPAA